MTRSRSGSSGKSVGICSWSSDAGASRATEISSMMLSAIFYQSLFWGLYFLDRDSIFRAAPILNLRQKNQQYTIFQLGLCVFHANCPTQRHDATETPIASLGTKMRNDFLPRPALFLFSINANLIAVQRDFDLTRRNAGEFDANKDRIRCLANISRWFERCQRSNFRLCGFVQNGIQFTNAFGQSL